MLFPITDFPVVIVESGDRHVVNGPIPLIGADGVQHPAGIWNAWVAEDWARQRPHWEFFSVRDEPPMINQDQAIERLPPSEWVIDPTSAEAMVAYRIIDASPENIALRREALRSSKVRLIDAERDRRLTLGALFGGKRISMSDANRTDLGGMAVTAMLAKAGTINWPVAYARGWIALDNSRLALPTPDDGIALAATVAGVYAGIVQHARDLKDDALKANDPTVVDELAGWPA